MSDKEFRTLNELFLKAMELHPKPDAFLFKCDGRYQRLSSQEALGRAAALARALDRHGVRRGDGVAIFSENRLEWALSDYAILGLGAVTVPIYPTLFGPELEYILRDSAAKGVIAGGEAQLRRILEVRSRLPDLSLILFANPANSKAPGVSSWREVVESEVGLEAVEFFRARALAVEPRETASILYTSGTTGTPKGVILTHSNIASNIRGSVELFPLAGTEVGMSFLPLSHIFERALDFAYFWQGVTIAYAESFEALPQNFREVRPTVVAVVPRALEKIYEKVIAEVRHASSLSQKLFAWAMKVGNAYFPYELAGRTPPLGLRLRRALADRLVFSKIRAQLGGRLQTIISGAAPLSRELLDFYYAVGLPLYEGYGLTETSPVLSVNSPGHVRLGSVGRLVPGVEVRFGEPLEGQDAGAGREIMVRGPNVTSGYFHLEEENRRAFSDGWFHTGDLGSLDADGYLTITGRKKNLFKTTGGKYVSPDKLENIFQGHPYVTQVVILGDSRKFVAALIVPNFDRLEAYARSRGIAFESREKLVSNPTICAFMQSQVDEATLLLPPHEKIRQIALLPREFTTEAGELSTTLKIKRRVVEERYSAVIEEVFSRHAPAPEK